jgi:thermitase
MPIPEDNLMLKVCRHLLCSVALGLAAASYCQSILPEIKGNRELTGRMIVRPYTPTELIARGVPASQARAKALEAWLKIEKLVIRQDVEVGEAVVRVPAGSSEKVFNGDLMKTGLYAYANPDWRVFPIARPNDPRFADQWQHRVMQSEAGWDLHTGIGITVAIADTGVELTHPDLRALLVPGFNAPTATRQADGGKVDDINGHGTHVAGCAAARGNNGVGVAGVTWNAKIMPIRVSDAPSGGAFSSDMYRGIRWAVDNGAKVINLSYSGIDDPARETTGAYVRGKGGLYFNGSGNDARDLSWFDWPNVVVVGASDSADRGAGFSGRGLAVDVYAPGVSVLSSVMGGGYGFASGTSMAGPVAAGVAALIWSYVPSLTSNQVETILGATCDNIGPASVFGHGRVNVRKAMLMARDFLTAKVDLVPSALTMTMGTWVSGSAAQLGAVDGGYYLSRSASQPRIGHTSAVTGIFRLGTPSQVTGFDVMVSGRVDSSQSTVASLFLLNRQTNRFDLVSTVPITTLDAHITHQVAPSMLSRYLSATGEVSAIARAYAGDSRSSGAATGFSFKLDRFLVRADIRR